MTKMVPNIEIARRQFFTSSASGLGALALASLLVGLVVVLPILGHATWHIYRKAVEPETGTKTVAQAP